MELVWPARRVLHTTVGSGGEKDSARGNELERKEGRCGAVGWVAREAGRPSVSDWYQDLPAAGGSPAEH